MRERGGVRAPARRAPTGVLTAFAAWAFVRFILGGHLNLTALRDATPYAYTLLGVLSGAAIVRSTEAGRVHTSRLLTRALAFHAAWFFAVVVVWSNLPNHLPTLSASEGIHVFTTRNDFDTALVGVYAALLLHGGFKRSWAWPRMLGIAMCIAAMGVSQSRAGVIGAAIAVAAVLVTVARNVGVPYATRMTLAGLTCLAIGALAVSLPFTVPGQRVLGTLGIRSSTYEGARAVGTTHARERAWSTVIHYSEARPERLFGGVGFGPNFMQDSGAIYQLTSNSETNTRAPHSWWVDVEARLGLIGLALAALLATTVLLRVRIRSAPGANPDDQLVAIASLVVLALIVPLSVGVIMESPFGAIPFYWCAGVLLGHEALRRGGE